MSQQEMPIRLILFICIYPYLIYMYCVSVFYNVSGFMWVILHPLFLVQKKIVRIITFSAFLAHTAPIFFNLRLLPLNKMVLQRTSVFSSFFFFRKNYLLLSCATSVRPSVCPSVRPSVRLWK